jgi:hypothetical protein
LRLGLRHQDGDGQQRDADCAVPKMAAKHTHDLLFT